MGRTEEQVAELMRLGSVHRHSLCAHSGSGKWRTIDDLLPLLKWEVRTDSSSPVWLRVKHESRQNLTSPAHSSEASSPLRSGWICFFLGLAIAWIIPLGHVFYSVAIILGIVALCRMPPRHGLTLLICSLFGIGLSAAISLTIGASLMLAVMSVAMQKSAATPIGSAANPPFVTVPAVIAPRALPLPFPEIQRTNNETSKARDNTTSSAIKAGQSTPISRAAPSEEITIQLGEWRTVQTRYGSFTVKIVDHGPVTFSVRINGEQSPRRLDKIKGFETTGTNLTQIANLGAADVYYIDRISVPPGYCVLKVVSHS